MEFSGTLPSGDSDEDITIWRISDFSVFKEAFAGMKVSEICPRRGFSEGTCYNWKAKSGGLEASDLKRMKEPKSELS